jgi:hypothetical protein
MIVLLVLLVIAAAFIAGGAYLFQLIKGDDTPSVLPFHSTTEKSALPPQDAVK